MGRVDLDKLNIAIKYVERISNGNNPVNNLPLEEESALANQNVIRCMHFIKNVLEDVRENGGFIERKPRQNKYKDFPLKILNEFKYEEDKTIVHFLKQLQEPLEEGKHKRVVAQTITSWLKDEGYLRDDKIGEFEFEVTAVTEKGKEIGMYNEKRTYHGRDYLVVVYGKQAQEFMVENFATIISNA